MEQFATTMQTYDKWSLSEKVAFRLCLLFFALHIFPFPLSAIPYADEILSSGTDKAWSFMVDWSGKNLLHLPEITVKPNGSGDTTWNWVQEFLILVLSAIGCFLWSIFDRKRLNYKDLSYWTQVCVRYYLGFIMLSYGFAKVFPLQFGNITTYRLHQQLGDMSPMGLLWTFMAYSEKYQFFAGAMEVLGGVLLFFRRTLLLGAVVSFGVMLNVFILNMCFDVPVKLYSFLLVLMSLYIMSPDAKRLVNFFILNQPTEPPSLYIFSKQRWYRISRILLKFALIGFALYSNIKSGFEDNAKIDAPKGAFYGAYSVSKFIKNGVEAPESDTLRWEKTFIDRRGPADMIYVSNEMGLRKRINFAKNDTTQTLTFTAYPDTMNYTVFFNNIDTNHLIINGVFQKDSLHVELSKLKKRPFLLPTRGFHWINELPFNK